MDQSSLNESTVIRVREASKVYRVWDSPVSRLLHILAGDRSLGDARRTPTGGEGERKKAAGFREFHALRSANLEVHHGECVGLLGYNGSGKSTLLQIVAGTLTPTSGTVEVRGRVAALLELGSGFNPEFTGRENVFLYASILGLGRAEMQRRFADVEAFAEIGDFIDEPVRTYSSGMVVRLAFSVLTQIDPDILIIDEALSVGDAYFQHKSMGQIRKFRSEGKSILFVSHDTGTVKSMCDRALILENGIVIRDGQAQGVCDYYNAMIAAKKKNLEIRQSEGAGGRIQTRSGNKRVVISAFEIMDEREIPSRAFVVGAGIKLSCVLEFRETVHSPTVGFLIRDRLGNSVFGTNTFHLGLNAQTFERRERGEFIFDIKLDLAPGRYSVTLATHAADNHTIENFDWVDNLIAFEVIPGSGIRAEGPAYLPVTGRIVRGDTRRYRHYRLGEVVSFGVHGESGRYKLGGWSHPEEEFTWTEGEKAALIFQFEDMPSRDLSLNLRVAGHTGGGLNAQRMVVSAGSIPVGTFKCTGKAEETRIAIPASAVGSDGFLEVEIATPDAIAPAAISDSRDHRKLGLKVFKMSVSQLP